MSIKLYNGYILPDMTHLETQDFLRRTGDIIRPAAVEEFNRVLYGMAVVAFDRQSLGWTYLEDKEGSGSPLIEAETYITKKYKEIKVSGMRNPMYDFEADVCLIPAEGGLLALFYADRKQFVDLWESMDEVESFGYWNNTDPPDDVTDKEWKDRGQLWEQSLGDEGIPSRAGYTYEFVSRYDLAMPSELGDDELIPSLETRINTVAGSKTEQEWDAPDCGTSSLIRAWREYRESDEGKKAHAANAAWAEERLKPKLTRSDLIEGAKSG